MSVAINNTAVPLHHYMLNTIVLIFQYIFILIITITIELSSSGVHRILSIHDLVFRTSVSSNSHMWIDHSCSDHCLIH